jgi:hypothetical protein
MAFPIAGSQVYYNEAGEPLGWDSPSYEEDGGYEPDDFDEPDPDDFDEDGEAEWVICDECGNEYESGDPEIEKHKQETGHKRWS